MKQKSLIEPVTMVRRLFRPTGCILVAMLLFSWTWLPLIRTLSAKPEGIVADSAALEKAFKQFDAAAEMDSSGEALDIAEKVAKTAHRDGFDIKVKAAQLGKDVDKIFAFVRDEVRFEAYSGVLRGPRGTLMARAGNSFDRALLLGALLKEHGYEVRYPYASLNDKQASLLASAMLSASPLPPKPEPDFESPPWPAELKKALQDLSELTMARWINNVRALQTALGPKEKLWEDEKRSLPALVSEVREYVWIEYRENDAWTPLDPAAAGLGLKPGSTLAEAKQRWQSIPLSKYHKVAVLMIQEERDGNAQTTREMLKHEARADELDGAEVSFRFDVTQSGMGWSATPVLLVNGRAIRGRKSAGNGLEAAAPNLAARLFSRPGEPPKKGGAETTAAWLEFRFISPTGTTETLRREIFDRVDFTARELKRQDRAALAALPEKAGIPLYVGNQYAFSFSSGPIHSGLIQSYLAPHFEALRAAYPLSKKLELGSAPPTQAETSQLNKLLGATVPTQLGAIARRFHMLSWESLKLTNNKRLWEHLHFYAVTPRLAIASIEPRLAESGNMVATLSLDLRRNNLRTVGEGTDSAQSAWANVVRGVLDAVLEDMVLRMNVPPRERLNSLSTIAIAERAGEEGNGLRAVAGGEDIANIKAPDLIRARMNADAGSGILLLAPSGSVKIQEHERLGWWHIDVASGETLGIMDTGLHQSTDENLSVLSVLALAGLGLYYNGWWPCYDDLVRGWKTGRMFEDLGEMRDRHGTNGVLVR